MLGILLLIYFSAQSGLADAREALRQGDYCQAWEAIGLEGDELARFRGIAEILYEAGDPAGAFNAARAGIAIDAGEIELVYRAAGAAIWLEDGARAMTYSRRLLETALAINGEDIEGRSKWQAVAQSFVAKSQGLLEREGMLDRALWRARIVAGASNLGLVVIALVYGIRVGRAGRSRR